MKRKLSVPMLLFVNSMLFSQIGINTGSPKATFDIVAKTNDGSMPEGLIMPRLTGNQIKSGDTKYGADQKGVVIYATSPASPVSTKTSNITSEGYYFFDGNIWQKLNDGNTDINIYKDDGTLTSNRVVTMGDKTLSFTASPTSGTSHFFIDGTTFNVDALNNRVGVGISSPFTTLNVANPTAGNTTNVLAVGINNCGDPCGQATARNIVLYNANTSNSEFASIDMVASNNPTNPSGASIQGIDRDPVNNYAGMQFVTRNASGYDPRMVIRSTGFVGINTVNPGSRLEVNGAITNTSAYNAASGTTIDFSQSNLAYTSASASAFVLTNIKDGGTYTLAVRGSASGVSTFSSSGFTVRYVNNNATTAGTHTLYTFLVVGTVVYVYTTIGFN